jgi:hypothetical protein
VLVGRLTPPSDDHGGNDRYNFPSGQKHLVAGN